MKKEDDKFEVERVEVSYRCFSKLNDLDRFTFKIENKTAFDYIGAGEFLAKQLENYLNQKPGGFMSQNFIKMEKLKAVKIENDELVFNDGLRLLSDHDQDCCEHHYLDFADLDISDFDGLEFDLTSDKFFNRVEDYGIELVPINGHVVRVPGYGYNNGYYGSNIDLIIADSNGKTIKSYDVSECQKWDD